MNAMLRQNRQMLRPLLAAAWLTLMAATGWAENIRISPSTAKIHEPITFELTGCSSCENIVWVFTKIGDPSVGNGGDGYTVTIPFPIAGRYRARVTGTQAFGAYSHYVTAMKEFTVTATPFTITILPREGGIVRGGIGQEDGIECSLGLSSNFCTETYLIGQNAHLKVIPNPGWFFLGWMLNDLPVKNAGVHQVDIDKMSLIKDIPPIKNENNIFIPYFERVIISAPDRVKRDEIFDVTMTLEPLPPTNFLALWEPAILLDLEGEKTEELPERGTVQMYDFGYDIDGDGDIDSGQTSYASNFFIDRGMKTIKVVYNSYHPQIPPQTIKITASIEKDTFKSEPILVLNRIRQYTLYEDYPALATVNKFDLEIVKWVDYWDDWNYPDENNPYTFKETDIDYDLVKAICYKETLMKSEDVMTLTPPAINGLSKTGGSKYWRRDWNWRAMPDQNGQYEISEARPFMNYSGVSDTTASDSIKWGIRWLYVYKTNASRDDSTNKMYNPQWIGWEDALSSYRSTNEESEYAQKVMAIYKSGKNPHTIYSKKERKNIPIKPHYLWPVMTDGFSRDSGFSKKEKAYLRWVLRKNAQQN